jgi:hypothetical protein
LEAAEDPRLRPCDSCVNDVYFCDSIEAVREGAFWSLCAVAIDPRIIRQPGDLAPTAEMEEQARAYVESELWRMNDSAEPGTESDCGA